MSQLAVVTTKRADEKLELAASIPFFLCHAVALAGPFLVGISWKWVGLALFFYYLRMAGTTIGYHRYFSHRAFKTGRVFQFVLAFWAELSVQKGALWWAAHHRDHHRYSDTEQDVHSPKRGFWWSHVGWILCKRFHQPQYNKIKDYAQYPELVWLDKLHMIPPVLLAVGIWAVGGWGALVWGFFVSTVLLWHGTFLVNSLNHVWGSRRYPTTDTSRNNPFIVVFTMGEGWHNNHHHYQSSANQGFFWWEVDPSFYLIKLFQAVGLVWDVRKPPEQTVRTTIKVLEERARNSRGGASAVAPQTAPGLAAMVAQQEQ